MHSQKKTFSVAAIITALTFCAFARVPKWSVYYGSSQGCQGSALELLTSDFGEIILREKGVYSTHVLPLLPASAGVKCDRSNMIVIGTPSNNPILSRYIAASDVPKGGYIVKTFNDKNRDVVVIAGDGPREVLWGAADFTMDAIPAMRPDRGNAIKYEHDVFFTKKKLPSYTSARSPKANVRSVFTWGHPIDDFRAYLRNLARLKFNRVYFWNDYPPINAADIVDYAHRWGIEVYWGFAWGWSTNCRETNAEGDEKLISGIIESWREKWKNLPGDGIYFQTFTETNDKPMGNETVAERAVRLVNRVAESMLKESPEMNIVFGLHATSVKNDLPTISKTDPRLEILWEDTANFPYSSAPLKISESDGDKLTAAVIAPRDRKLGIVWKSQLVQDWSYWSYQEGPFLMGVTSRATYDNDVRIQNPLWENYSSQWILKFPKAHTEARRAHRRGSDIELCVAAQLNGPLRLPTMLTAELFWDSSEKAETILERVLNRKKSDR